MAKKKEVDPQAENQRLAQLEAQNQEQLAEIAKLKIEKDKVYENFMSTASKSMVDEIDQLRREASKNSKIEVKLKCDHKNVSLWTPYGRRVGPMHPDNLERIYKIWRALNNVTLQVKQPTPEEVEVYYKTPEGAARLKAEKANRARKQGSLKKDELTRLAKLISDSVGGNMEKLKYAGAN